MLPVPTLPKGWFGRKAAGRLRLRGEIGAIASIGWLGPGRATSRRWPGRPLGCRAAGCFLGLGRPFGGRAERGHLALQESHLRGQIIYFLLLCYKAKKEQNRFRL